MGGYGSGRRSRTPAVEECVVLTMAHLKAWGMLHQHCLRREEREWRNKGQLIAALTITTDINCREQHPCIKIEGTAYGKSICHYVLLDAQPMRFGGVRWFALCPSTGRRCTTLVLMPERPTFIARMTTGLPNMTQRMDRISRAQAASDKAERRIRTLSKYARYSTRDRLVERVCRNQAIVDGEIERFAARIRFSG